jgi:hypothetical protein
MQLRVVFVLNKVAPSPSVSLVSTVWPKLHTQPLICNRRFVMLSIGSMFNNTLRISLPKLWIMCHVRKLIKSWNNNMFKAFAYTNYNVFHFHFKDVRIAKFNT